MEHIIYVDNVFIIFRSYSLKYKSVKLATLATLALVRTLLLHQIRCVIDLLTHTADSM